MKSTFEKAKTVAIAALNESHRKHDPSLNKIMDCKFCSSAAAEGTIARHFEPIFKEVNTQQEQIERLTAALEHETSEKVRIISERTTLLAEDQRKGKVLEWLRGCSREEWIGYRDGYDSLAGDEVMIRQKRYGKPYIDGFYKGLEVSPLLADTRDSGSQKPMNTDERG